jgi:hypothetical protein
LGVVLSRDVLPFATTWGSDDGHIHFRWVEPPEYGGDYAPVDRSEIDEGSDFRMDPGPLFRLKENLLQGPIRLTRISEQA